MRPSKRQQVSRESEILEKAKSYGLWERKVSKGGALLT